MSDIHFVETLVVKPGDRVLLRVDPADVPQELANQLGQRLREHYPDVEFTVLAVPGQLAVIPSED